MLKKLRSLFVIDEAGSEVASGETESAQQASSDNYSSESSAPERTVKVEGGEVNERFMNILLEAIEKNDIEGFDYLEFKRFLKSLNSVNMDEATRYRSAFATGQTMGTSREKLVNSAQRYLEVLEQEEARFEQAVQNQRSKVVDDKQSGISNLEKVIKEKEDQISRLTTEIEQSRKDMASMREEIALAQAKIQQTQADFQKTYQHLIGQLREDVRKINLHLQ